MTWYKVIKCVLAALLVLFAGGGGVLMSFPRTALAADDEVNPNISIIYSWNADLVDGVEIYQTGGLFYVSHDGGTTWQGPWGDQPNWPIHYGESITAGRLKVCAGLRYLGFGDSNQSGTLRYVENPSGVYTWTVDRSYAASACFFVTKNGSGNFNIHYDANGGSGAMTDQAMTWATSQNVDAADGMPHLTKNAFVRTGYTFAGWNTKPDGTGDSFADGHSGYLPLSFEVPDNGTLTLYAQWKPIAYSVHFAVNGGSSSSATMADQAFTYDKAQQLSPNLYSRGGYDFVGWNTAADGSGAAYADGQEVQNLSSQDGDEATLYAQWKRMGLTVNVNLIAPDGNEGYGSVGSFQVSYDGGKTWSDDLYDQLPDGSHGHYNNRAFGSSVLIRNVKPKEGLKLTGIDWKLSNGIADWTSGMAITRLPDETWRVELPETAADDQTMLNINIRTAYIAYTVKFETGAYCNRKTVNAPITVTYGQEFALPYYASDDTDWMGFTRWTSDYGGDGTSYSAGQKVKNLATVDGATVILYAQGWRLGINVIENDRQLKTSPDPHVSYDLSLDDGTTWERHSGIFPIYSPNSLLGHSAIVRNVTTTDGWRFLGANWLASHSENIRNVIDTSGTYTVRMAEGWNGMALILKSLYTVRFDGNGAGGSMEDQAFVYDTAQSLTPNSLRCHLYTFMGWNTKADGTGTSYADGQSVSNLTSEPNGVVTLYAQWKRTGMYLNVNSLNPGGQESQLSSEVASFDYSLDGGKTWVTNVINEQRSQDGVPPIIPYGADIRIRNVKAPAGLRVEGVDWLFNDNNHDWAVGTPATKLADGTWQVIAPASGDATCLNINLRVATDVPVTGEGGRGVEAAVICGGALVVASAAAALRRVRKGA